MTKTSEKIPGREPRGMLSGSRRKVLRRSVAVAVSVATISFFTPSTAAAAAPVFDAGTSTRSVAEHTSADMSIKDVPGVIIATDPDTPPDNPIKYALIGLDAASFKIDPDSGQIQTETDVVLNYESKTEYTVTVTATDAATDTASIDVTITVTNVAENPVFDDGASATREVAENTAPDMAVGYPITATDPDLGAVTTYVLGGEDAAYFGIVDTSGQILTKGALDYESRDTYSVTVRATDDNVPADSDAIVVTISVTNVDESAPTRTPPPRMLAPEQVPEFVDVDGGGETQRAIELIAARGIARGDREGRFRPKAAVSRAYAAVFIARVLGYQQDAELAAALAGDDPLTDVDVGAWYAPSIYLLMRLRIMRGYSDGTFRPHQLVTRAEMATLLVRAFTGIDRVAPASGQASFVDVDPRSEHAAAIEGLRADGVTVGCLSDPPRYCPDKPVTRAQLALFLARALRLADN